MTFEDMRNKVVRENNFATEKELNKVVANIGLTILTTAVWLGLATLSIVGLSMFIFTLLCLIAMFILVCSYASESKEGFTTVKNVTKFWWVNILITVGVFIILKMLYFIK